ncbi:lytic transglycosylase domain-containing protein [Pseudoxanthomonas sacheonensis]|uniref:Membrane-bound lytic murein transglycosylase D n=1 Tax=Pseudoxanthomonas sacheonensis TaxID=443615 RepID=A0ABU1RU35_9GAMM|nr:transglycosylase SLT domain-containing protein [Pseudoxanthomonas sacheonensis]MDR6842282.1 membrane-bound lytic murein transglycosylase D [Pseudoxanthomonas sacheonensis]
MRPRGYRSWALLCALGIAYAAHAGALRAAENAGSELGNPERGDTSLATTANASAPGSPPLELESLPPSRQRNGREIYESFRAGLADPTCDASATSMRWKKHFGHAPGQLARGDDDLLPLFGYVVDALRDADLPTEFALIPFVESGYKPGARSASGPAGLWQFIGVTARNHGVAMRGGYDGRLSPVDSTQAAVRYLKTLHGMFGGDWRLAVMGYNAGEYRILQSMRRAGMNAQNAKPAQLPGLSGITYAYVEKLHALACIFQQADDREEWLRTLDRDVPRLAPQALPSDVASLDEWAKRQGHDGAQLRRLNPALAAGFSRGGKPLRVLAPAGAGVAVAAGNQVAEIPALPASMKSKSSQATASTASPATGSHTVRRGESAWTIARRYGLPPQQLLARNGLASTAVLQPGMVLKLDGDTGGK